MNVLYCGDKNIEDGLIISVLSLLKNVDENLNIYVLTINSKDWNIEGVTDVCIEVINSKMKKINKENWIKKIDITNLFEKEVPAKNMKTRFTPCCMLRLFADEIAELPDRLLYLDTDIICRKDFTEFYYQNMENVEIAGVLDYYGSWFFRKNIFKRDYLNSGVLLMNMVQLKKTGLLKKCREMCTSKQMFMPDQSALNKLSVNKKICERKYNDQRRLHSDTVFQHFTTHFKFFPYVRTETVKPWQTEEVFGVLKIPREEYEVLFNKYKNALAELGSYEI